MPTGAAGYLPIEWRVISDNILERLPGTLQAPLSWNLTARFLLLPSPYPQ